MSVPTGSAMHRRHPGRGLLALAFLLVVTACGDPIAPPPTGTDLYQRLLATAALDGVQVRVTYAQHDLTFQGVSAVPSGVIARTYDDGAGSVTIGLVVTGSAVSGQLLTLHWKGELDSAAPVLASVGAYDAARASVAGAVSLGDLRLDEQGLGSPVTLVGLSTQEREALIAGLDTAVGPLALDDGLADFQLGDVDQSGAVDVLDALFVLDVVTGATADPSDVVSYHADLSGDDEHTVDDVELALAKAVDPTAPAVLVVRPSRLTYLDLVDDAPVLVANGGSAPLAGLAFAGTNFSGSSFSGTSSQPIPGQTAVYSVSSNENDVNGVLTVSASGQQAAVSVGNIVFLIAGQSNASGWGAPMIPALQDGSDWPEVRALGNDYVWKPAVEGLDNNHNQLDSISSDSTNLVSAGVTLGRLLNGGDESAGIGATDRYVYLIPAALGGSRLTPRPLTGVGWRVSSDDLADTNRSTLFGSAAYRGLVSSGQRPMPALAEPSEHDAEGGPVTAVFWYQGESDSSEISLRSNFAAYTGDVFSAFEDHFQTGAGKPVIIYAQLASYGYDSSIDASHDAALGEDLRQMDIAERQRRLEEGAYNGATFLNPNASLGSARQNTHMVVTNDLPRSDRIHISSAAQQILAERIALAYQEHYMGLDVDGTGPRVQSLTRSGNVVTITFDRDITQTANPGANGYAGFFTAWNGTPSPSSLSAGYGESNKVAITDVRRHPSNSRAVLLTLASSPATIYVRYMRPHENTFTSSYVADVVRGEASGLPLPSFGPLRVN